MLRKTTAAVVLAGALALGTASATSLGTFDDVSFAASDVGLQNCEITTDTIDLSPLIPTSDTELATLDAAGILTFAVDTIDLSMLNNLPATCTGGTIADVMLLGGGSILDSFTVTDLSVDLSAYDIGDLTDVTTLIDVADVEELRIVVRNDTPA